MLGINSVRRVRCQCSVWDDAMLCSSNNNKITVIIAILYWRGSNTTQGKWCPMAGALHYGNKVCNVLCRLDRDKLKQQGGRGRATTVHKTRLRGQQEWSTCGATGDKVTVATKRSAMTLRRDGDLRRTKNSRVRHSPQCKRT